MVWGILALELLFEVIIRPKNYSELIASEKAFAPSVARHINRFHLIFEFLALLTFIPEFNCLVHGGMGMCDRISHFDRVQASMDAVLGRSNAAAARGHFLLSITALRFFGVVRHWKQMWINNTFQPTKREGVQKWLFRQDLSFRQNSLSGSLGASKGSNLKGHKKKKEVSVSSWTSSSGTKIPSANTIWCCSSRMNTKGAMATFRTRARCRHQQRKTSVLKTQRQ